MLEGAKSNMKLYFRPRPFGRHPPAMITAKEMTVPATTDQRGHASTIHITQWEDRTIHISIKFV